MSIIVAWVIWSTAWLGPLAGLIGALARAIQVLEQESAPHIAELRRRYGSGELEEDDRAPGQTPGRPPQDDEDEDEDAEDEDEDEQEVAPDA